MRLIGGVAETIRLIACLALVAISVHVVSVLMVPLLSRADAYSLMSVAADFAVTQVVDGKQGIHVRIPRSIFPPRKTKR